MNLSNTIYNVPDEFKQISNWVLWKQEPSSPGGKPTKIPYQLNNIRAKSNTSTTWSPFEEVVDAYNKGGFDGIGWCVPLDGGIHYWGLDFDDAIDPDTGEFNEWRLPTGELAPVQPKDGLAFDSYTEMTPSGAGYRVYVKCSIGVPEHKKKNYGACNQKTGKIPAVEMYSSGRFFAFTGEKLSSSTDTVKTITEETALAFHAKMIGEKPVAAKKERTNKPAKQIDTVTDEATVQLAFDIKDGHVGSRHDLLFAIAGTLVGCQWDRSRVELLLRALIVLFSEEDASYDREANIYKHFETLDDLYKRRTKKDAIPGWTALKACLAQPTFDRLRAHLAGCYLLNDTGNGMRLVDKHRNTVRYCADEKCWYVWDGIRWNQNESEIQELAKGVAFDIRAETEGLIPPVRTGNQTQDDKATKQFEAVQSALSSWANQSGSGMHLVQTIKCASSDPRISCVRSDFDSQPHLLNCTNGVIDLKLGTLMPHDRHLMLSYLCPVDFNPTARHPVFEESLRAFTRNHDDLAPFLKTLTGYTIQGAKSEERIIILHGLANHGKGMFMDSITNMLGPDYACAISFDSIKKQDRNSAGASGDIARLEGKRLVIVSEIDKGSKLAESFMKQMSGNDSIIARQMYKGEREFRPTHQFWLQTNYRPGFDSQDSGNKRRYMEIPFDNDLSKDPLVKFDGKVKLIMRHDKEFLMAVLAWAVAGAVDYYADGLHPPACVKAATAELLAHNDFLSTFMYDECIKESKGTVRVVEMLEAYNRWSSDQGETSVQGHTFNHMMEERGFKRHNVRQNDGSQKKMWRGIRLKDPVFASPVSRPATPDYQTLSSKLKYASLPKELLT